ncbi:predicted protein [Mycolicibacterium brisbanense]|uniref:Uncharacterized protein n=1 Tax=Mycolicibacterium brisbanense TaxID=146020 RepID=A0A100W0W9_9MYCO|nr:predicted protein [Mycolicibacterium brisbanense]
MAVFASEGSRALATSLNDLQPLEDAKELATAMIRAQPNPPRRPHNRGKPRKTRCEQHPLQTWPDVTHQRTPAQHPTPLAQRPDPFALKVAFRIQSRGNRQHRVEQSVESITPQRVDEES